MALVMSVILVVIVLFVGFKDAKSSKHPILTRILVIVIAAALVALAWLGINYFTDNFVKPS